MRVDDPMLSIVAARRRAFSRDPIPVVLLGRLAVDKGWQEKKIGRFAVQ
jgi:predicted N-acetyltransferase YhbS